MFSSEADDDGTDIIEAKPAAVNAYKRHGLHKWHHSNQLTAEIIYATEKVAVQLLFSIYIAAVQ